ncbi:MAG: Rrf2 family transcriptional regulator [Chitinophagaceae bacterium]|jgi:Rrf2 family protein|nr:Rrf2 family transcriptional regulator [Chitinophagaceae bacterium]
MLSLGCKAAIKAVIFLATRTDDMQRPGMAEVADHIGENVHTVGKLLQKLVRSGIIHSSKGPNGGFYLSDNQLNRPIIDIVQVIDGEDVFNQCGLGLSECSNTKPCPLHNTYKGIRDDFERLCREFTIRDACQPVKDGNAFLMHA